MKKNLRSLYRFRYLIVSVLLFALGYVIDESYIKFHEVGLDTDKFLKVMRAKETNINRVLNELGERAASPAFLSQLASNKVLFDHSYLKDNGFAILIYKDDSLRFWTDNSFELKPSFSESCFNRKLCLLSNGWYVSNCVKKNNVIIVGLFLVKYQYDYTNKFLNQEFHKDFGLSSSVRVSIATHYVGGDIYDKDNNYLLTLVPSNVLLAQNPNTNILAFIYLLAILFLLKFLQQVIVNHNWDLLIVFGAMIALRVVMMIYKFPHSMYNLPYFMPQFFADYYWFPSLGDLFLNSLLLIFIVDNLYVPNWYDRITKTKEKYSIVLKVLYLIASSFLICLLFIGINYVMRSLILNSKIPFHANKILDLSQYSLVGFVIIALLFGSFYLLVERLISIGKGLFLSKSGFLVLGASMLLLIVLSYLFHLVDLKSFLFLVAFLSIFIVSYFKFEGRKTSRYVILISITALYCSIFISETLRVKENGKKKVLVEKLVTERDQVAEYLLGKMDIKLKNDSTLKELVTQDKTGFLEKKNNIVNYLKSRYFNGYWSKYILEIDICGPRHEYQKGKNYGKCADYYLETEKSIDGKLKDYNYYYVENKDGSFSYIGFREYHVEPDSSAITLFLKLNSRLADEDLGYPELLLESKDKDDNQNPLINYSYAKYTGNNLITKHGLFYYSLDKGVFGSSNQTYSTVVLDGYEHLVYKDDKDNTIVLSSPVVSATDIIVVFAYLFLFFNVILFVARFCNKKEYRLKKISLNFNTKLFIATNSVMFFSFLLVGGGTVVFNIDQYKKNHQKTMNERIQSALKELEQEYSANPEIFRGDRRQLEEVMNRQLVNLSQVIFADLNLYDLEGKLIATSRSEIYDRGFVGKRINATAYEQLVMKKQAMFVQEESIGNLEFSSAYVPFRSTENQTLAYLHLPYFTKPELLKRNISTSVVAIGNLYAILFILSLILAAFISNGITQPLVMLKRKFTEIELGKKNEPILYESQDEIGSLVKEYNRMVEELKKNIDQMAKNEREAGWKEMSRMVAHELKNPLMPMRLNMQHLQKLWLGGDERFGLKFIDSSQCFISQIDRLTRIINSFASFAKLPMPNNAVFKIAEEVRTAATLFQNNEEGVDVRVDVSHSMDEILVFADKEEFSRVVINLVKNSIQAIPPERKNPYVKVLMLLTDSSVKIEIEDNGSGISEEAQAKLFTPSFTTKTSGSGLGLAMSRSIIHAAQGSLTYETTIGEGTTFFVELPIYV